MLTSHPTEVGAVVRQRRIDLSMSQTELAEKIGTTRQWMSRFEKGNADVSLSRALAILRELDMTVDLRPRSLKTNTLIPADSLTRINESIAASLRSAELTAPLREALEANAATLTARLTDTQHQRSAPMHSYED